MSAISTVVPDIDLNLQHKDIFLQCGDDVTIKQWSSSNYSTSSISFSCPPPSMTTFIDRYVVMGTPVVISYTGTVSGGLSVLLQNGGDALRAYPMASVTTSTQVSINNQTFSMQTSDIIPFMAHYLKQEHRSTFPDFLDKYAVYSDGVACNNNPLGTFGNGFGGKIQPRGAFPCVITNTSTTASISATIYEPLWLPPFHLMPSDGLGFSNVRTMDIVVNLSSNLSRIVSHAINSNVTISGLSVAINQPILYMKYTTPKIGYVPRPLAYGSQEIVRFPTAYTSSLAPNASSIIVSSNLQLNAIPSHMYLFVREANSNLTYTSTDTFCNISAVNITFNNRSGLLSSASEVDLYNMSKDNGLQDTWEDFHGVVSGGATSSVLATPVGSCGSVIKLSFGKDISLNSVTDWVGRVGAYNLQINVTATNRNQGVTIANPTLYVIPVTPQKLIFHEDGNVESVLGLSQLSGEIPYVPFENVKKVYGGSFKDFIGKVAKFFKPIVDFLKENKIISKVTSAIPHPVAQTISSYASKLGFGEGEGEGEDGGRVMSRSQLNRRMRRV